MRQAEMITWLEAIGYSAPSTCPHLSENRAPTRKHHSNTQRLVRSGQHGHIVGSLLQEIPGTRGCFRRVSSTGNNTLHECNPRREWDSRDSAGMENLGYDETTAQPCRWWPRQPLESLPKGHPRPTSNPPGEGISTTPARPALPALTPTGGGFIPQPPLPLLTRSPLLKPSLD